MRIVYLKNFRCGYATNSSSTHSLIYKNEEDLFDDLNVLKLNYYDRCTETIAASREAKIKYVLASIMYNKPLVKMLLAFYPEMKQYLPLIEESEKDGYSYNYTFGMYSRGNLYFEKNVEASVDYLREVIENPEIIIIGGSDERDFYYDTIKGKTKYPDPEDLDFHNEAVFRNGNYWFGYGDTDDLIIPDSQRGDGSDGYGPMKNCSFGRIRFAAEGTQKLVPEYPELVDLKITDKCEHGCEFCFNGSNKIGKHADITFLKYIVRQLSDGLYTKRRVEFSVGGGNILLYPHLEELFSYMHENGHIINVTIKADDVDTILESDELKNIFNNYVNGIGISTFSIEDVKKVNKAYKYFVYNKATKMKEVVAHLIPEYLGVDKTCKIIDEFINGDNSCYAHILFLGYKELGRGANCQHTELSYNDLESIFKEFYRIRIDTTFGNRYIDYIKNHFSYKYTVTFEEGEYSMYIDGVNGNAYKSSYHLEKPYNLRFYDRNNGINGGKAFHIIDAFANIRKDGGFKTYSDVKKIY